MSISDLSISIHSVVHLQRFQFQFIFNPSSLLKCGKSKVGLVEWWNDAHDSVQVHASSIERVWQNRTPYVCLSA